MGVNMRQNLVLVAITAVTLTASFGLSPPAQAAMDASLEADTRAKANAFMTASKWSDALPLFAQLYAETAKSSDLWNAAVCQFHLAKAGKATPDEALSLLRKYQTLDDVLQAKKDKARRYGDEMTALKTQQEAEAQRKQAEAEAQRKQAEAETQRKQAEAETQRKQTEAEALKKQEEERARLEAEAAKAAPAPAPAPAAVPPAVVAAPATPPPSEEKGSGMRIAAWSAGGVGAAALGAGLYFSQRSQSLSDKVAGAKTFVPSDDSAGLSAHTMQYVMYGIGAACLATAGILYVLSPETSNRSSSVALLPTIGPDFGGAGVAGHF
jgi:hypothetical protein